MDKINEYKKVTNLPYKEGFHDLNEEAFSFEKGLNEEVITKISHLKNEPQ